jgi:hypothetical protein
MAAHVSRRRSALVLVIVAASGIACNERVAHAQISPVFRLSTLDVSSSSGGGTSYAYDTWTSGVGGSYYATENLALGPGSIQVTAQTLGDAYQGSPMQGGSWSISGAYTGDFTFDLLQGCPYTLSGALMEHSGVSIVTLYDVTHDAQIYTFSATSGFADDPFSTSGTLAPGRYNLHIHTVAFGVFNTRGAATVNLSIVPSPAAAWLLSPCSILTLRRSRR